MSSGSPGRWPLVKDTCWVGIHEEVSFEGASNNYEAGESLFNSATRGTLREHGICLHGGMIMIDLSYELNCKMQLLGE